MDRSSLRDGDPSTAELPFMLKRKKPVNPQGHTAQGPLLKFGLRRKGPELMSKDHSRERISQPMPGV